MARQFIWQHWGLSEWHDLPSANAKFELRDISIEDVKRAIGSGYPASEMLAHGEDLLRNRSQIPLGEVMYELGTWPVPPILVERTRPIPNEPRGLPTGLIVVEGHTRMSIAKALAAASMLKPHLTAWFIEY